MPDLYFPPLTNEGTDFDELLRWLRTQTITADKIIGNVIVTGDVYSNNWDGAIPADLSSVDTTATVGYYLDASEGAPQFQGNVYIGGDLRMESTGDIEWYNSGGVLQGALDYDSVSDALRLTMDLGVDDNWLFGNFRRTGGDFGTVSTAGDFNGAQLDIRADAGSSPAPAITWTSDVFLDPASLVVSWTMFVDEDGTTHPDLRLEYDDSLRFLFESDGLFKTSDGSASDPSHGFHGDLDTGMYLNSSNILGFSAAGTEAMTIRSSTVRFLDGSSGTPAISFISDGNTGIYRVGSDQLGFVAGGVEIFRLVEGTNDQFEFMLDGTEGAPVLTWQADQDTGIWRAGANNMQFSAGGTARFAVISPGTSGIQAPGIGDHTTSDAANVHIETTGSHHMRRSTSSLRYKPDWLYADESELAKLELPNPIVWTQANPVGDVETYLGFGTEHVAKMLPAAVQDYSEYGPENYDVRSLVAILVAKVKALEAELGII